MESGTILVIEDDALHGKLLTTWLTAAGYRVILAPDGKQGLEKFFSEGPCLVITDIYMPVRDGLEVIRAIRQQNKAIPIFAISGGGTQLDLCHLDVATKLGASVSIKKSEMTHTNLLKQLEIHLS